MSNLNRQLKMLAYKLERVADSNHPAYNQPTVWDDSMCWVRLRQRYNEVFGTNYGPKEGDNRKFMIALSIMLEKASRDVY